MRYTSKNNIQGFSLIEMLVYIAILILAVVAMVVSFLSFNASLVRNQAYRELTHVANLTLDRMVRDIRAAASADTTVSNQITLSTEGGATTTVYALSNDTVNLTVNGKNLGTLTEDDVKVEDLTFSKFENIGTELETTLVRVQMTLSMASTTKWATTTSIYYTSAVMRGDYE